MYSVVIRMIRTLEKHSFCIRYVKLINIQICLIEKQLLIRIHIQRCRNTCTVLCFNMNEYKLF